MVCVCTYTHMQALMCLQCVQGIVCQHRPQGSTGKYVWPHCLLLGLVSDSVCLSISDCVYVSVSVFVPVFISVLCVCVSLCLCACSLCACVYLCLYLCV